MAKDEKLNEGGNAFVYEYVIEKEKCTTIANTYGQSRISIQLVHENFVGNDIYRRKPFCLKATKNLQPTLR